MRYKAFEDCSEFEFAWAIGILEGEGCFHVGYTQPGNSVYVSVGMNDHDVVDKLFHIIKVGTFRVNKDDFATWRTASKQTVREVCEAVLPFMGNRRSEKIKEVLDACVYVQQTRYNK